MGSKNGRIDGILKSLAVFYPSPRPSLNFASPFELLVAVILSARCTDRRVNEVTARLFKKYRMPQEFASLDPGELALEIKECGLHVQKSRYIVACAREIVNSYGGRVPPSRSELEKLPGVGSKTAGVVAGIAYGEQVLPVDTHVFRVARRTGLASGSTPSAVEAQLSQLIEPDQRLDFHFRLIAHGRQVCRARKPKCSSCCIASFCIYASSWEKGQLL